ncbi:MAG: hypothetical protein Q8920_00165 [Bacillota bacterium]|nr:hypothetical protein [Bacillota bacterium]
MRRNLVKGSVTVEASLVLPIFIGAVLTIVFLIKLVFINEVFQHAINGAAHEMASTSYIYYISGVMGIHDTVRDGLENGTQDINNKISSISGLADGLENLIGNGNSENQAESIDQLKNNFNTSLTNTADVINNPLKFLKDAACLIAGGAFDDLKNELCIPVVKLYMKKYLSTPDISFENRIKGLNIAGGADGIDLNSSSFFEDEKCNIDIIVRYKVNLPFPFRIFNGINVEQRAVERAWTYGDKDNGPTGKDEQEDVWALGNLERGRLIRERFGANLPFDFPVIAAFDSGKATMIKSMDLTTVYYQSSFNVKDKILDYINELRKFNGGKRGSVEIGSTEITQKVLKLVIPENELKQETNSVLEECRGIAAGYGIQLDINKYQTKKTSDESGE